MADKEAETEFSENEMVLIRRIAARRGITVDEAASELLSTAIEKRMRRSTKRSPATNVTKMRTRRGG